MDTQNRDNFPQLMMIDASKRHLLKAYQTSMQADEAHVDGPLPTSPILESPSANFQLVQVVQRILIAKDVVKLSLARPGTTLPPAPFLAGQYITLMLPGQNDIFYRTYSLSNASSASTPWEITVKYVPQGIISCYLFKEIREGMVFQVSLPQGNFILPPVVTGSMSFVFLAGGSGITPIGSMIRTLAVLPESLRPRVFLHHAMQSVDDSIYTIDWHMEDTGADWLQMRRYVSAAGEHISVADLKDQVDMNMPFHWYISGSNAFVHQMLHNTLAQHISLEYIHTESRV